MGTVGFLIARLVVEIVGGKSHSCVGLCPVVVRKRFRSLSKTGVVCGSPEEGHSTQRMDRLVAGTQSEKPLGRLSAT